jgi:cell division protein ZapB
MSHTQPNPAGELSALESKLDVLIDQFNQLKDENRSLKVKQEALVKEKAKLLEKTALAKARVEAMIVRLKAMEQDT